MKGLVYQGELDQFWGDAEKTVVDYTLLSRFRSYLIRHTQLNGNFYRRLPIPGSHAGMRWEERRRAAGRMKAAGTRRPDKSAVQ
jgi:capsular polysaccharide export protein